VRRFPATCVRRGEKTPVLPAASRVRGRSGATHTGLEKRGKCVFKLVRSNYWILRGRRRNPRSLKLVIAASTSKPGIVFSPVTFLTVQRCPVRVARRGDLADAEVFSSVLFFDLSGSTANWGSACWGFRSSQRGRFLRARGVVGRKRLTRPGRSAVG